MRETSHHIKYLFFDFYRITSFFFSGRFVAQTQMLVIIGLFFTID